MPPIPVQINAPLHPDGVTPKTAEPEKVQQPPPTTTTSLPPSGTYDGPPPPQPGARPAAPTASSRTADDRPPAPQPGAFPTPTQQQPGTITEIHTTTQTVPQQPPSQFSIPAPTTNYAPTHSTSTHPSIPQPNPLAQYSPIEAGSSERRSLEHPPGYVQNPYAADGTARDRARFESAAEAAKEDEGVLGSVKAWAGNLGSAAKKVEEDTWRFINERNK